MQVDTKMKSKLLLGLILFLGLILTPCYSHQNSTGWVTINTSNNLGHRTGLGAFKMDVKGNFYQVGARDQAFVRKSSDQGHTWNTIYELKSAIFNAFATDQQGMLYVAGMNYNNDSGWLIQKSTDDGKTWSTIDTSDCKEVTALEVAPNGEIYAGGGAKNGSIIRKSSDNGKTWHTVDQFYVGSPYRPYVNKIVFDSRGNIYYVVYTTRQPQEWYVRMSSDRGASWTTIDKYSSPFDKYPGPFPAYVEPTFAVADSAGNIYISGTYIDSRNNKTYWIVRKGSKKGTWKTVDFFSDHKPNTIVIDKNGTILVSGIDVSEANDHAVVRMSTDGGAHWTIRDDIPIPDSNYLPYSYVAFRLLLDNGGNLYATLSEFNLLSKNVYWLTQKYFPLEQNTRNFHS